MTAARLGWVGLTVVCGVFALLALEYPVAFFVEGTPRIWQVMLEAVAGSGYARGAGSVHAEQSAHYLANRWILTGHIVAGALTLGLAPLQFSDRLRERLPRLFRGLVLAVFVLGGLSMTGALLYLLGSNAKTAFGGPIFMAQSWGMLVVYLSASSVALFSSHWEKPAAHRAWSALAFGLLLSSPLLRIGWLFGGWLWPHIPQASMSPAIAIAVLPVGVLGAGIYVSKDVYHGPPVDRLPVWTLPAAALLFVSFVLYVPDLTAGDLVSRATVTVVTITTALIAATATAESALARGRGDELRAREWHGYALSVMLGCVPGAIVTAWLAAFGVHVPTATAVGASLAAVAGPLTGFVLSMRLRNMVGPRQALPELAPPLVGGTLEITVPTRAEPDDPRYADSYPGGGVDVHDFMQRH